MNILITGGAGFIGSHLVKKVTSNPDNKIITIDKLTYAGNRITLSSVLHESNFKLIQLDIINYVPILQVFRNFKPDVVFHLAAESHVDRSIDSSKNFVETNVVGTHSILNAANTYWIENGCNKNFRMIHVSTDEVFGSIATGNFTEKSRYQPNSPYAASKAAGDMFAKAFFQTYKLPVIVANCSNNYGSHQYPEKLIPTCIQNALEGKQIPIYGDGQQIRDWIYVEDHVYALLELAKNGTPGENYCVGANCEKTNREIVTQICDILDKVKPRKDNEPYSNLIEFVTDRPGHDRRYAVSTKKIYDELKWLPQTEFNSGLHKTVKWYCNNQHWIKSISGKGSRTRLGLKLFKAKDEH